MNLLWNWKENDKLFSENVMWQSVIFSLIIILFGGKNWGVGGGNVIYRNMETNQQDTQIIVTSFYLQMLNMFRTL
jgi:hypothetical protein